MSTEYSSSAKETLLEIKRAAPTFANYYKPSYSIITPLKGDDILRHLEHMCRKAYMSYDKMSETSHYDIIKTIMTHNHQSVLEHFVISVDVVTNIGVSRELNRHRIAAITESSTRYCNFTKDKFGNKCSFVVPLWILKLWQKGEKITGQEERLIETYFIETSACSHMYETLINSGAKPQEARELLPLNTKTEEGFTANIREWRHIFSVRCSEAAHPNIRQIMLPLLHEFYHAIPLVFDDLYEQYKATYELWESNGWLAANSETLEPLF